MTVFGQVSGLTSIFSAPIVTASCRVTCSAVLVLSKTLKLSYIGKIAT